MKITLRQLEVFIAIASHGQVTRAAENIAMTQAAASMALADLERQLGAPLFDRVGRQLLLNEIGRQILPQARDVVDRAHNIENSIQGQDPVCNLHLGASVTIGNHLLPGLLAQFRRHYPQSTIHIARYNTEQVAAHVINGQVDIGFIEGPVQDERIRRLAWQQDQLMPFAAPNHPLAGKILTAQDLRGEHWIVRELGSGTRRVFDEACAQWDLQPNIAFELEQPEAIRQCVKAGLGIGCLSELELEDAFKAGSLVPLQAPFLDLHRHLDIILLHTKFLSQAIQLLLKECGLALPLGNKNRA